MNHKILFVDDDVNVLDAIQRSLRKQFVVETAVGANEALKRLASDSYDVIVADMQMPDISGLEFLRKAVDQAPHAVRMVLTGNADLQTAMDAVNDGHVYRFLTKPCPPPVLISALESGLEHYRLMLAERELLEKTLGGAVKVLTEILSTVDPGTFARTQTLKEYLHAFTVEINMKLSWELELAAMLSQIGRIAVPRVVEDHVRDGVALSETEEQILDQVPELSARLIANIPRLDYVATLVRYQHKHFDGTGYPLDAMAGEDIPFGARILKVLIDLIDLESRGVARADAFQQMSERKGWYDLKIVAAVSRWCNVALDALAPLRIEDPSPRERRIDELCIGQTLAQDILTKNGLIVLKSNAKLTALVVAKLKSLRDIGVIEATAMVYAG